jgi:serine/threonine protein kinase
MGAINHKNVVKLAEYEYSTKLGITRHYIVEEFISGNDMSDHMTDSQPWGVDKICRLFSEICDGLAVLHQNNIIHRDLKPNNVRIRSDGSPVIIDFGLARLLDMSSLTGTIHGAMIGTPRYFAPEQFTGTKRDIDHRTDLYALGVMMYEAATARHPSFVAAPKTLNDLSDVVCSSVQYAEDPKFKSLDSRLQVLICRLLEKERAKRPANAEVVARALRALGGI